MLAEDEKAERLRSLADQATFAQAIAVALTAKDGPQRVLDGYTAKMRAIRGGNAAPQPTLATIMADPYLAAFGARIARQSRRRRKKAEKGAPDAR